TCRCWRCWGGGGGGGTSRCWRCCGGGGGGCSSRCCGGPGRCGGFFSFSCSVCDAWAITSTLSGRVACADPSATANKMAPTNSHSFVLDIGERFIVRFKFVPDESVPTGA